MTEKEFIQRIRKVKTDKKTTYTNPHAHEVRENRKYTLGTHFLFSILRSESKGNILEAPFWMFFCQIEHKQISSQVAHCITQCEKVQTMVHSVAEDDEGPPGVPSQWRQFHTVN